MSRIRLCAAEIWCVPEFDGLKAVNPFRRGLRDEALDALWLMAKSPNPNWWKDLLILWSPSGTPKSERKLRLAIRDNYLNFYLRGQSVARVAFDRRSNPFIEVHVKYAFDDAKEQDYAKLIGTEVLHAKGRRSGMYAGPATLREWMERAATWETPEKAQVDRVVADNPRVIDLEMGIPAYAAQTHHRRIDLVALEPVQQGARIVFWEAKLITDDRLKSNSPRPAVMTQIEDYRRYLSNAEHRRAVVIAYRETCRTLGIFGEMAACNGGASLHIDPLVLSSGEEDSLITVDPEPRLAILGSEAQYLSNGWFEHEGKLVGLQLSLLGLRTDSYRLALSPVSTGSAT